MGNTNSSPPVIYFYNPEAIQEIFAADPGTFSLGKSNRFFFQHLVGENSLLLQDGDRHQRQRRLLMPAFHGDRMSKYGDLIYNVTSDVISQWEINKPFVIRNSTQEISLKVILGAVFGLNQGQRYEKLRLLISDILELLNLPFNYIFVFFNFLKQDWGSWSPWGRFLRKKQELDELVLAEIQTAREEGNHRDDILSLLLEARDEAGNPMSDEEIKDELVTVLFAGHETTASALVWALYWIDKIPSVREKLMAELATLPDNSDKVAITKLPYLSAVCQETLRIYPIGIFATPRIVPEPDVQKRDVQEPVEIMGYQLEPGMVALVPIYLTHHREDIYPEPKQFKPERFLERQFSPYEYLPFGGGSRRCIGSAFALFEMKLVLATILSQCELKLVSNRTIKPVLRGVSMAPPGNMRMVVKQKFNKPIAL